MPYAKDEEGRKKNREAQARWYEKNKKLHRARCDATRKKRRDELREAVRLAKLGPCVDCGVQYPQYVMDLDHVRGEKVANIASLVSAVKPLAVVLAEIDKCDLVFANCHRMRTFSLRD